MDPENPEAPVVPETPETPETPVVPENPETPVVPETPSTSEEPTNWKVFWNDETKSYELTFEIDEDAEGDQTIDLTKALELLNKYAQDIENVEKPVKPLEPSGVSAEDMEKYETEKAEFDAFYNEEIIPFVIMANDENFVKNHTLEEIVEEFNYWSWMHGIEASIPVKPEGSVDKDSPEYAEIGRAHV